MIEIHHLSREMRELQPVAVLVSGFADEITTGLRVPPPPNAVLRLVDVRYEIVQATSAGSINVKAADGTIIANLALAGGEAAGARGQLPLTGTDAQLTVDANGANAYHQLTFVNSGPSGGRVYVFLYYRLVETSGIASGAVQ